MAIGWNYLRPNLTVCSPEGVRLALVAEVGVEPTEVRL